MSYLDDAVLDGIEKRLARVLQPDALRARLIELLEPGQATRPDPQAIATRLTDTRRRIARLVDVLASGSEDLPSLREALATLERERARLEAELAATQTSAPSGEGLAVLVDRLLEELHRFRDVLEAGNPEERRAVVGAFLAGIRVEKTTRQAVLSWYRLPRLPDVSLKMVELRRAELEGWDIEEAVLPLPGPRVSRTDSGPQP